MEEQKLRKFRLINREGYVNSPRCNKGVLEDYFVGDIVEGYLNEYGPLVDDFRVVITVEEFKFFEEVFDTVTDPDSQRGETSTKEQKLRKFKIIDREGYRNAGRYDVALLMAHFVGDIVEGYIDEYGTLIAANRRIITPREFKFFEEVLT